MSSYIESAVIAIDERINTLNEEVAKLETAKAILTGDGVKVSKPKSGKTSTKATDELAQKRTQRTESLDKARTVRAKKSAKRQKQIMKMLASGMSVADVAAELEISKGYVYNTRSRVNAA